MFAVWDDDAALDSFLSDSPVGRRWRARTRETWHVRLQPVQSKGTWDGLNPLAEAAGPGSQQNGLGVVFTRIDLRARAQVPFWRLLPGVAAEWARHPGFLAGALMTEPAPPLVRNATFSLWTSLDQAVDYAYRQPWSKHAEVMSRMKEEGWQKEMYFACFRPYASFGTWEGNDPLEARKGGTSPTDAMDARTGRQSPTFAGDRRATCSSERFEWTSPCSSAPSPHIPTRTADESLSPLHNYRPSHATRSGNGARRAP